MTYATLYTLPIWANWLLFLVVLLLSVELGYRVGLAKRKRWPDAEIGGGGVVLTSMLALLGLILAFTSSASASRHEVRKQAVIVEANAIGTAFLRADTIVEPERTALRNALLGYAKTRVIDHRSPINLYTPEGMKRVIDRQLVAQAKLWPLTLSALAQQGRDPISSALMASVNDVIDMHTTRVAAVRDRLPSVVVAMLLFIASAALAVTGYHAGLSGIMSRWRLSLFAMVLTSVMIVTVDLDRPRDGFVRVGQASMEGLVADMSKAVELESPDGGADQ